MSDAENVARISRYWRYRGHVVEVTVRKVDAPMGTFTAHYQAVRSNMLNGLPRSYRVADDAAIDFKTRLMG